MLHRSLRGCIGGLVIGVLLGCRTDTTDPAPLVTAQTPFQLTVNQHAINLSLTAPHNQFQLSTTLLNADGASLPDSGDITYRATDSSVTVSPAGVITSHFVTPSGFTQVIATRRIDQISFIDTAYVHVTARVPASSIATFSIAPADGDSAIRPITDGFYTPRVRATDAAGQAILFDNQIGNVYWIKSSDRSRFPYSNGANSLPNIAFSDTGHVTIYVTSWMYGEAVRDSLRLLVGWSLFKFTYYDPGNGSLCNFYNGCNIVLGTGGTVVWSNSCNADVRDIIFDNPAAVDSVLDFGGNYTGSGNLHFDGTGNCQFLSRRFPTPGTYHWHDVRNPDGVGVIYVEENPPK